MSFELSINDVLASLPAATLAAWGMVILLLELVTGPRHKSALGLAGLMGLVASLLVMVVGWQRELVGFGAPAGNGLVQDKLASFLGVLAVATAALTVVVSMAYNPRRHIERGEYYALVLFSTAGALLMVAGADLLVLFLGLELLSIPLYVLAGIAAPQAQSEEAALKYFLLGAFASGFLVFGIALVYGASGTTNLAALRSALRTAQPGNPLLLAGTGLLLAGLGFKVAAVPFHMWTPDVYEGAPTPVAGFMSVVAKLAGFAALMRVLLYALPALYLDWKIVLSVLAALTMIVGNVAALAQSNLKRLLAYSSIAHAGYLLIGLAAGGALGAAGAAFYLAAYAFTNMGAFALLSALVEGAGQHEDQSLDRYTGLGRRHPWLTAAMVIFMLSLMGLPPTAGFFGKYYLFTAALGGDLAWLAFVGVVTSLISAYYYLRVVVVMTMHEPTHDWPALPPACAWVLGITAMGALLLGLIPGVWWVAVQAGLDLMGG
ncbi:MAG: NADH-quinone oxidoreductase subunit N [Thermoflexales bacterium]|nr:NADH-quinone oxidoreductase subunit N [Thermoflexales bacterium]